jgi:hypothetical protein
MRRVSYVAAALLLAWLSLRLTVWTPPGFTRTVFSALGQRGEASVAHADDVDLSFTQVPHGPRRMFSARWHGVWHVDRAGTYLLFLGADDWGRLSIDGAVVLERGRPLGFGTLAVERTLSAGTHTVEILYEQQGGGSFVATGWAEPGGERRDWSETAVFPQPVSSTARAVDRVVSILGWAGGLCAALVAIAWTWALIARGRAAVAADPRGWRGRGAAAWDALARRERWLSAAGLLVVLALAGALRLDAIMVRYGPFDRPAWLVETEIHARERIEHYLRPHSFSWTKDPEPYVGGDPINYLRFGREMTSFYAAHVREPLFPGAVRVWLALLDGHDVAVSFASALFAWLAVALTWWLGRQTFGPWVGFLAALGLAMDKDAITWAADGWRDDTLMAFAVAVTIGLVGVAKRPAWPWALLLGVSAAGAILTRVTALSFLVPGVLAVAWLGAGTVRQRLRALGVAAALTVGLSAPYYYDCWRTFGDPLYAINVHTSFYRSRAGDASYREPMSASAYLRSRLASDPIGTARTGLVGLFWFPFENKWIGFDYWWLGLRRFLMGMAAIGLALFLWTWAGRFLWLMTLGVLLPYAFTWSIPGGGEWRFTLPAYPYYLIAAALALVTTARHLPRFVARLRAWHATWP